MAWLLPDGVVVNKPRNVTISGVVYPASSFYSWTAEDRAQLGIKMYTELTYDGEYYVSTGIVTDETDGAVVITHTTEPRYTVGDLQTVKKDAVKQASWNLLHDTDWYVVRKYEVGSEIPSNIASYRSSVRSAANDAEIAIDAIDDYETLVDYNFELPTFSG